MKRWLLFISISILGISCQEFNLKKQSADEILKKEAESINWNEVDFYPTFESCGVITSKEESRACFENEIKTAIAYRLENKQIVTSQKAQDTVLLKLLISAKGKTSLKSVDIPNHILETNPDLESLLTEAISDLPQLYPAQKRSVPVPLHTTLPIILK